jgi:hypothetical protein
MMTKDMPSPPIPNLPVISFTLGHPSLKEFLHVKSGGMTYDLTLNFFCGNYFHSLNSFFICMCFVISKLSFY